MSDAVLEKDGQAEEQTEGCNGTVTFGMLRAANTVRRLELFGDEIGLEPKVCDMYDAAQPLVECLTEINVARYRLSKCDSPGKDHVLDEEERKKLGRKIAQAVVGLDVLAARLQLDLGEIVVEKFNDTSRKFGAVTFLQTGEKSKEQSPPVAGQNVETTDTPLDPPLVRGEAARHEVGESRPVGDARETDGSVSDNLLHIYAQDHEHSEAAIVGDRKALEELRRTLDFLLSVNTKYVMQSSFHAMVADGEGFGVMVVLMDHTTPAWIWNKLAKPYTADSARENREDALQPYMLADLVLKTENAVLCVETQQCPPLVRGEGARPEKTNSCDTHNNSLQLTRGSDNEPETVVPGPPDPPRLDTIDRLHSDNEPTAEGIVE